VSINGFEASNWAERNSATLLFSALMTRIFGVKREKDPSELSAKNCLTGKVFFQRYPTLHQFLLAKLEVSAAAAGESSGTLQLRPALYPILLVLSRLFPSPAETLNNPLKLSAFVPWVELCSMSAVLAIRQLAASALVPLLPADQLMTYGEELIERLTSNNLSMSTNHVHGILLQLGQLKKACPLLPVQSVALAKRLIEDNCCPLVSAAYLSLINMEQTFDQEFGEYMEAVLQDLLYTGASDSRAEAALSVPSDLWKPLLFQECGIFLCHWSLRMSDCGLMLKLFIHPELQVRHKAFQLYLDYLDSGKDVKIDKEDVLNLILGEKQDSCLGLLLRICCFFPSSSFQHSDLAFFLSLLQVNQCEEVLCAAVALSGRILSSFWLVQQELGQNKKPPTEEQDKEVSDSRLQFAQTLSRFSAVEQTFLLRQAVIETLKGNIELLEINPKKRLQDKVAFIIFWSIILDLIHDDEEEVRDVTIVINKKLTGNEMSSELSARSLAREFFRRVGRVWPAAGVMVVLGNIITHLFNTDAEVDASSDKAFDKGEMNTYRELQTSCNTFLPVLSAFLNRLSPKLLENSLKEQLPNKLLETLLPHLPGGIIVYSINQFLEYFKARSNREKEELEILSKIENALTAHIAPQLIDNLTA